MNRRSGFSVMTKLIGLVKPLTGYMLLAIVLGLAGHLCAAFLTVLGGYGVLAVLAPGTGPSMAAVVSLLILFAAARGFLRYGEQTCNHYIAFRLLALIRHRVFQALRRLCPAKLEGRDKGDLISVITSDIELLEVFYAHTISPAAIALLFCLAMCLFIGSYHWLLGLTALVSYIIVGLVIPLVVSRLTGDRGLRLRSQSGDLSSFMLDSLRGLPELQQYAQGEARLGELLEKTENLARVEEEMKRHSGRNTAMTNTAVLLFDLTMLFVSLWLYQRQAVGFDAVLIPTLALFSSFGPVIALAALGSTLQNTFAAGNRVLDILEEAPVVEEVTGRPQTRFTGGEARNVSFSYGDEQILSNVSVRIPQDTIVGISGRSGSGKSTLLKLFMRFWDVQQGQVALSGCPVSRINTRDLRNMESFVTQQTHLFHDSIRNNLRIAKLDAADEEIEAACKKASVHDFIMTLPRGYDTPVGELGDTLSGGERQRLGLARAFLHNAPLMLLDEPTSNLDSLNEAVILKSLHQQREGKTVVLVSHRASTMSIASHIYSLEQGRIC